ncbi:hypothetical protein [Paraflavitalea speifideaquila]|uniref:hypothetical protein n=1 Tax=Paraflavitalea speifideaquila TaxID=3076558 RepID=UPI0028E356DE|nr:hypothetical protein [Paraflavitalea speifideiaquila]
MKKQSMYVVKTILLTRFLAITTAMILLTQISVAQTRAVAVREPLIETASVTHIGNTKGNVVFQVQYDNQAGDRFSLIIKSIDDTILFQDNYTDRKFNKRFQLPEPLSDKLRFIIRPFKGNQVQTFEVNTSTRIIEEIVVKKAS